MNRILANTIVTYLRSLFSLALGLFTSRWVLQALGVADFGLYAVVGALMAFVSFWGDLLRISVSRHFAFALGRGGEAEVREWFGTALALHLVLAVALALMVWPVGEWMIGAVLEVPADRLEACRVIFRLSLVSFAFLTMSIPFGAMFTAHQHFFGPSLLGMAQTVFVFLCTFGLLRYRGDRLIAYGGYSCLGIVGIQIAYAVWAFRKYGLINMRWGGWRKARDLVEFAGWNVFGGGGYLVSSQGTAFVTNHYFGPVGNTAYGVAQQVQVQTETLANALVGAFTPAVTEREGAGDRAGAVRLAQSVGFLGALLLALFAVPLTLEVDEVLRLWLVTPPAGAGKVCSILLLASVMNKLTMGQHLQIVAGGRIACWQVVGGIVQTLAFPLAILYAEKGMGIVSAAAAYASVVVGCAMSNLYFGQRVAGMRIGRWLMNTAMPFAFVLVLAVAAGGLARLFMEAGLWRIFATGLMTTCVFVLGGVVWRKLILR